MENNNFLYNKEEMDECIRLIENSPIVTEIHVQELEPKMFEWKILPNNIKYGK
jgi:hypothetical protein